MEANNSLEVRYDVTLPCAFDGRTIFNLQIKYVTRGDQLIGIQSTKVKNPYPDFRMDQGAMLNAGIHTLASLAVQSEHFRRQWQRLELENKKLREEIYQKPEDSLEYYKKRVAALIEQGIITQEQFDHALAGKTK